MRENTPMVAMPTAAIMALSMAKPDGAGEEVVIGRYESGVGFLM
jgi:hypothetical protein